MKSMQTFKARPTRAGTALIGLFLLSVSAHAQEPRNAQGDDLYRYTRASQDGIGKIYMDREISRVMGHQAAGWLERPDREDEERTDLLIENLPIRPGDRVADIGAGTGYFSMPMAEVVGTTGTVYAVDIQPEMLAIIDERAERAGISHIETVLATDRDPRLARESIDMALFVDAYHEFEWPREVMSAVYANLVPGGKVVLIEYRAEDRRIRIKPLHKMSEQQARVEMEAVGFEFVQNSSFLPQQHFLVFEKPSSETIPQ